MVDKYKVIVQMICKLLFGYFVKKHIQNKDRRFYAAVLYICFHVLLFNYVYQWFEKKFVLK